MSIGLDEEGSGKVWVWETGWVGFSGFLSCYLFLTSCFWLFW